MKPYVLREHKEKLNPPLNIGDVIRVVDVDKETKYKQSAGNNMYRNVTRGQLHGVDTFPTINGNLLCYIPRTCRCRTNRLGETLKTTNQIFIGIYYPSEEEVTLTHPMSFS